MADDNAQEITSEDEPLSSLEKATATFPSTTDVAPNPTRGRDDSKNRARIASVQSPNRRIAAHATEPESGIGVIASWDEDDLDLIETRTFERRGDDGFMPSPSSTDMEVSLREEYPDATSLPQSSGAATARSGQHTPTTSTTSTTGSLQPNGNSAQAPIVSKGVRAATGAELTSTEQSTFVASTDSGFSSTETALPSDWDLFADELGGDEEHTEHTGQASPNKDTNPDNHSELPVQISLFDAAEADDSDFADDSTWAMLGQDLDEPTGSDAESYMDWQDAESLLDGDSLGDIEPEGLDDGIEALDDLLDELPFIEATEEREPPLFDVDSDGDALSQYGKAERLALGTLQRTELDYELAWPILLDIFMESPWPRTQRSVEELISAGTSCEALELAAEIRRLWLFHPEFAMSAPVRSIRGQRWQYSPDALSRLSWPRAAKLADAWSAYPDVAEIERLLESLHERWSSNAVRQRQFPSFQLYTGYVFGDVPGALEQWPEFSFDTDPNSEDPCDRLETVDLWVYYRDLLRGYGINRPFAPKPSSRKSDAVDDCDNE